MVSPHVCVTAGGGGPQHLSGAQFAHGGADRVEWSGVRAVVVDHAQPGAVGAAHEMQGPAVDGDLPAAGVARTGRRDEAAEQVTAEVGHVEDGFPEPEAEPAPEVESGPGPEQG